MSADKSTQYCSGSLTDDKLLTELRQECKAKDLDSKQTTKV